MKISFLTSLPIFIEISAASLWLSTAKIKPKIFKIKIKIPCLLAYGKSDVYENASELYAKVILEAEAIRDYYKKHTYIFEGFDPEIVFYVFPIESIKRLRDKEKGFYAGLC